MSTCYTYYPEPACPHCGKYDKEKKIEIGTRSGTRDGFKFYFRRYLTHDLKTIDDWLRFLKDAPENAVVIDEYDEVTSVGDFLKMVVPYLGIAEIF